MLFNGEIYYSPCQLVILLVIFSSLSVLYSVNLAYGLSATSLEELESQLEQENSLESRLASYRAALIDYIETHYSI